MRTAWLAAGVVCSLAVLTGCASAVEGEDLSAGESAVTGGQAGAGISFTTDVLAHVTTYEVAAIQLNCRAHAGTSYDVLDKPTKGQKLTVVDGGEGEERLRYSSEMKPWIRVKTPSGKQCYVAASYSFIRPAEPRMPKAVLESALHYDVFEKQGCYVSADESSLFAHWYEAGDMVDVSTTADGLTEYSYGGDGWPWIQTTTNCWVRASFERMQPMETWFEVDPSFVDR